MTSRRCIRIDPGMSREEMIEEGLSPESVDVILGFIELLKSEGKKVGKFTKEDDDG